MPHLDLELLASLAIQPGPTQRFLERAASGAPFHLQADTAWELCHRLDRDEALYYLDKRREQGFNSVLTVLLTELDAYTSDGPTFGPDGELQFGTDDNDKVIDGLFLPNRSGDKPLHDDDPARPNEAYFAHVDWVVQAAAERGILLILVPTWSRWLNGGWAGGPILFNRDTAESFGAFVGERYPFLPKVLGGDSNPEWTDAKIIWRRFFEGGRKGDDLPLPTLDGLPRTNSCDVVNAMAKGIMKAEAAAWKRFSGPHAKPFLTYHPTALWLPWSRPALASSWFGDEDWLSLDGCQSGHADFPNLPFAEPSLKFWDSRASHVPISEMWQKSSARPVIDLESHYEQLHNALDSRTGWMWDHDDVRSGAWQSVLSGACGVVYGANAIWQMYDPERSKTDPFHKSVCGLDPNASWKVALELPGPSQLAPLRHFIQSLPADAFHNRRPAQDLVTSVDGDEKWRERDGRVDAMLFQGSGGWTLAAHTGRGEAFVLDLGGLPGNGTVAAQWLDPRSGKRSGVDHVSLGRKVRFDPPGASRGQVKDDWVLILVG